MAYLLQHLLAASAASHPEREAVCFGPESLTYAELDDRSSRFAAFLSANGVRPDDRVGLHLPKSVSAIVSIYGVLKAGAVYVPLDTMAPGARLGYILRDCGVRTLVTGTAPCRRGRKEPILDAAEPLEMLIVADGSASEAPDGLPARRVVGWETALAVPSMAASADARIETDLAYILYTSGSTGEPKGVMISHRNALTFVNWCFRKFGIIPGDRLSNHAPFHFDLSIFDVFVAARAGASVRPVPEGLSTFPLRLAEWIERERISVWYSVPSVLTLLALHGRVRDRRLNALRLVLFAGEVFPLKHLQALVAALPSPRYFNLYGPTETNVCTYYEVERSVIASRSTPIPIGRACENFGVFAVGDAGRVITQPGEMGELLVRGSGVAMGYWGRPERTSQGFVQSPIEDRFRDVVYRTGDLVTIDESGDYLFQGRSDHQIKSRGYRIELGEIESALYQHPRVREAAAIAVPDDLIGNRIKAVVSTDGSDLSEDELRSFCADRLPRYMVPDAIEFRDNLPRTLNGKIDRRDLLGARS